MERFCESRCHMALFRYFKREKGNLPDPHGPLARSVPSTSIAAANSEVCAPKMGVVLTQTARATTKFFPQNSQNYDFHENITPRKIPAIRYIYISRRRLDRLTLHCNLPYFPVTRFQCACVHYGQTYNRMVSSKVAEFCRILDVSERCHPCA